MFVDRKLPINKFQKYVVNATVEIAINLKSRNYISVNPKELK